MANKTISIGFSVDDKGNGLKELTLNADGLRAAMQYAIKEAESLKKTLIETGDVGFGFDAIKSGFEEITQIANELTQAYAVQMEVETKLETVMRERMGATISVIQSIKDLAAAQQEIGIIGDEVQLAGAQQIATFLETEGALKTLIPAMNNLVAQQKGYNATANDAVTVGNIIGKVMQGQTSALKRVGITFSTAQEEALKYADEEERAAIVAEIITQNVGNMNQRLAETPIGFMKQVSNSLGDIQEKFGSVIASAMPMITVVNQIMMLGMNLGKLRTFAFAASSAFRNMVGDARAAAIGVNGVSTSLTVAKQASIAFKVAWKMTVTAAKAALISSGIGAAIWLLGEALGYFYTKLIGIKEASEDAADGLTELQQVQMAEESQAQSQIASMKMHIEVLKNFKGSKEEERKICEELNNIYGDTLNCFYSVSEWYEKLTANSEAYSKKLILEAKAHILANKAAAASSKADKAQQNLDALKQYNTEHPGWTVTTEFQESILNSAKQAEKDLQDEISNIYKEIGSLDFSAGGIGKKGSSGVGIASKVKQNQTPPPPEGSIEFYEKQISEIDKKIKLEIDQDAIVKLEQEKAKIQAKLDGIKANIYFKLHKEEIMKEMELDPIKLEVDFNNMDFKALLDQAKKIPMVIGKSSVKVKDLSKELESISGVCAKAGQAFANMGQAFEIPALNVMGIIAQAIANMVAGYASASSQSSEMGPWAWLAFSLTGLAELTAMITQVKSISKFANGGIVSGPTMALVGEYAGAANNPEVIAPLNKLRSLIGNPAGAQTVVVGGDIRLRGSDLVVALRNQKNISGASGKRFI